MEKFGTTIIREISKKNDNEIHIEINDYSQISNVCIYIYSNQQFRLSSIVCIDNNHTGTAEQFTLNYVFRKGEGENIFLIVKASVPLSVKYFPSITLEIPSAVLYEREIKDMFGLVPFRNPDTRMLVAHEFWPKGVHPLRKEEKLKPGAVRNSDVTTAVIQQKTNDSNSNRQGEYPFHHVDGEGVCEVPLGPVYASTNEPIHFKLSILGEDIINVEARLFYSHRGIEKLAETRRFDDVLLLSERIAGDESVANSTAFCQAMEKIAKLAISESAAQTRVVCAELERMYNYIGTIAGLSADVGFTYGSARMNILKERVMQLNERISGSRILFGVNRIGGTNTDIAGEQTKTIIKEIVIQVGEDFQKIVDVLRRKSSFIDRLRNTGIISKKVALDLGAVGVAARAAGIDVDTRRDHPYAGYPNSYVERQPDTSEYQIEYEIDKQQEISDALSRLEVRVQETKQSVSIIKRALDNINNREDNVPSSSPLFSNDDIQSSIEPFSSAIGYTESHRGETIHWISIGESNKTIARYKVRTASFCNWALIEHAIHGDIMLDFPVIIRSLDLSSAGNDL